MVEGSVQVSVGDMVTTASPIGQMGDTGNVTGIHLHLEHATTYGWQCGTFLNPATFLQIPNEIGTIVNYNGIIPPPPPPTTSNKNWAFYRSRKKRIIF